MKYKFALIMDQNVYPGREYLSSLKGLKVDVISIGQNDEFDAEEDERCGGHWHPEFETTLKDSFNFYQFESLRSKALQDFLSEKKYHYGIQGGAGILKKDLIELFMIGILNFHPGDLPFYRGCSAPEWQILEKSEVVCTAHLIDEGIDTGKILSKKVLNVNKDDYHKFRASIYPETANFVVEVVKQLLGSDDLIRRAIDQDENIAIYRKYIGESKLKIIKNMFPL